MKLFSSKDRSLQTHTHLYNKNRRLRRNLCGIEHTKKGYLLYFLLLYSYDHNKKQIIGYTSRTQILVSLYVMVNTHV